MLDPNEAALLRSIAEEYDDDVPRLVLADWLEERGQGPRAEFIRVQCELASADLAKKRRQTLRVRERELLDAHRQDWLQEFGLPIEDVRFERGLIAGMRLAKWANGKLLDATHAPRFATVTELDLSGLGLGDEGLRTLASTGQFPALRKLILSQNDIGDTGATALASAAGFPKLDTVYLFPGRFSAKARKALEQAAHFRLTTLDLGERPDGYAFSPGEADVARRDYIRTHLLPLVSNYFRTYERLQSAVLCVAQYWADEANDAVHGNLIVSDLFEPVLEGVGWGDEERPDPNLPHSRVTSRYSKAPCSSVSLWEAGWDDNSGAIPLWAAFAAEEGSQEYGSMDEVYTPAVMFYRHGGYDMLPMSRPQLDGIRPEWSYEDEE